MDENERSPGRARGVRAPRLVAARRRAPEPAPVLDADQAEVVAHGTGPLLVLGAPGTGKTTALVEAVVARLEAGAAPEELLVLTGSRRAAGDLRDRITRRWGRATIPPRVLTFHGFCAGLVRRFGTAEELDEPSGAGEVTPVPRGPRLLTAPEQEWRVRELLAEAAVAWPEELAAARSTSGFVGEVRAVMARARQQGMDPGDLVDLGVRTGRPDWSAIGEFLAEYLDVLDAEGVLDYAELVHRTRILLADEAVRAVVRREITAVLVDEYQDTDRAQHRLVRDVVGPGGTVIAAGEGRLSVFGFRGSDPRALADFAAVFGPEGPGERAARVVALGTRHRAGRLLGGAGDAVAARLPVAGVWPGAVAEKVRVPRSAEGLAPGRVRVRVFDDAGAEAEHIADLVRRAHLGEGVPWSQIAVLVRSGRRSIPRIARALTAAGVCVEVAGDEIPLAAELAVRPLLVACELVAGVREWGAEAVANLLTSPLGGLDALGVRRLARALWGGRGDIASGEAVAQAVADPDGEWWSEAPDVREVRRARELGRLLAAARTLAESGASAAEVLWSLWSSTGWPQRLQDAALATSRAEAVRAGRDLDAVRALFDLTTRFDEVAGLRGLRGLVAAVEGQRIAADTRRDEPGREAVRLLTAHRAQGLEFDTVIVAGVQEQVWPSLRRRSSLLDAERMSPDGLLDPEPTSVLLAEERRLFLLACTRARRELVVTCVGGTEGEGEQPSRFVAELGVPVVAVAGRPRTPLHLSALVAELRRVAVDPDQPPALREGAAVRLARLAEARDDDGRPVAPSADPARWWGMLEVSGAGAAPSHRTPRTPRSPVRLSGSELEMLLRCPRQWFLERRARLGAPGGVAAATGSVVHRLIEHEAAGELGLDDLAGRLDAVWDDLAFEARWKATAMRSDVEDALARYAGWSRVSQRRVLASEVRFSTVVDLGEAAGEVELHGTIDRLELDAEGRLVIVDFKTGRRKPTATEMATHPQLGLYQAALAHGALDDVVAMPDATPVSQTPVAGAELVLLALQDPKVETPFPVLAHQASLAEAPTVGDLGGRGEGGVMRTWADDVLAGAAGVIRAGQWPAVPSASCERCAFATSCPAVALGEQVIA